MLAHPVKTDGAHYIFLLNRNFNTSSLEILPVIHRNRFRFIINRVEFLDSILPFATDKINAYLVSKAYPKFIKSALITPTGKNVHNDLNNYRPVSSICFIVEILEEFLVSKISSCLNLHNLYNTSAHIVLVTALLKLVNDQVLSLEKGNVSILTLFDFISS